MASNSDNNVPATRAPDSGGNKRPKLEASSVDTNSAPRKELAEQIAQSLNWLDLPRDVTMAILMKLSTVETLKSAQFVCKFWYHRLCKDPAMWRIIDAVIVQGSKLDSYKAMLLDAIDRSSGGLQVFKIECLRSNAIEDLGSGRWQEFQKFENNQRRLWSKVLPHLAKRAKDLKCLCLKGCSIQTHDMIEAAKKLPLLEEVEFSCCVSGTEVKAIGCSCPRLKSFKLNCISTSGVSLAIAESMPNLCHLELLGFSSIKKEGVQAILDGCPNLVSLDLRGCKMMDLSGSLGKRCAEQIKNLRVKD